MTTSDKPLDKRPPITRCEAGPLETKEQKFERYLRQLSRCVMACSLCKLGDSECFYNNTYYDPHCPNPFIFNKIMFLKFSPNESDIANGLFMDVKQLCDKYVNFKFIYKTVVSKCHGESSDECPYFDMEMKASGDLFKLIIIFDKESADKLGVNFIPGKLDKNVGFKTYCCNNESNFTQILKLIKLSETNLQIHNSLFV